MRRTLLLATLTLGLVSIALGGAAAGAQQALDVRLLDARARQQTLDLIRQEKFDLILPGAMRDNGIDMWIHWIRMGNPDPLEQDLGAEFGVFIFTDRGGARIERAVLQPFHLLDRQAYDIVGDLKDLRAHVHERDPQRIGINSSAWLGVADGMSYNDYQQLVETIGPLYAEKLVSAEQLITDFRVRRVRLELAAFSTAGEMTPADARARAFPTRSSRQG